MANIKIGDLAGELEKSLTLYSQGIVEKIDEKSEKAGKTTVKKLRSFKFKDGNGEYSKSWTMTTEETEYGKPKRRIIHVRKPHYRLAHLLEHGHAKVNGGRVEAIPHIKPVEEEASKEFLKELKEAIENGG